MAAMVVRLLQPKFGRKNAQLPYIRRLFTTKSESIVYSEHGDPEKVLRWEVRKQKKKMVTVFRHVTKLFQSVFFIVNYFITIKWRCVLIKQITEGWNRKIWCQFCVTADAGSANKSCGHQSDTRLSIILSLVVPGNIHTHAKGNLN